MKLTLVSCLAPCLEYVYRAVAEHLGARFCDDASWQVCEQRLYSGEADLGFLCGLPYVRQSGAALEILGCPVFAAARYGGWPVYFSDVVVRADAPYQDLEATRGSRWAYNEPNSQSGYNVMRWRLRSERSFFARELESGSHAASIALLLRGEVDVACIDTTVLEELRPAGLRVLETLGPSPIQPLLVSTRLPAERRSQLRARLLEFGGHGPVQRFVAVPDSHYDDIRRTLVLSG